MRYYWGRAGSVVFCSCAGLYGVLGLVYRPELGDWGFGEWANGDW